MDAGKASESGKRKPGGPKGSSNKKLAALEALFSEPIIESRRRVNSAHPDRLIMSGLIPDEAVADFFIAPAQYGQVKLMESMLRKKAKVEVDCRNASMNTGLHEAALHGQCEAIKLLLKMGANPQAENLLKEKSTDLCKNNEAMALISEFITMQAGSHYNPVLMACWKGRKRELKTLLQSDEIKVNVVDPHENSALHYAAAVNNIETAKILFSEGIDTLIKNVDGNTALHLACRYSLFARDGQGTTRGS